MRPIALLAALALTASAAPALAQTAPAPASAPVSAPASAQDAARQPVPTEAELEAAAEVFGAVVEALEAQASVIRADASLSAEQREAAIMAVIAERQTEILAFVDLVQRFVVGQALAEGMPAEDASQQGEMVRGLLLMSLAQALVEGRQADAAPPQ